MGAEWEERRLTWTTRGGGDGDAAADTGVLLPLIEQGLVPVLNDLAVRARKIAEEDEEREALAVP